MHSSMQFCRVVERHNLMTLNVFIVFDGKEHSCAYLRMLRSYQVHCDFALYHLSSIYILNEIVSTFLHFSSKSFSPGNVCRPKTTFATPC
jgi:hypothetical protein